MTLVGVVGGGQMGSGIAEVSARSGHDVIVVEVDAAAADRSAQRLDTSLARAVSGGRLTATDRDTARSRVRYATDLADLADRQVVVEAVIEDEAEKARVLRAVDSLLADPAAVLATNTSSLPITRLAAVTAAPERVVGIHFFNPVPVLPLVEVIPGMRTTPATVAAAEDFARTLGKTPVRAQDRAGFVVNALLIPYLLSAVRMLEAQVATAADIDTAMVAGCAHPMGPLALADLIGLDTVAAVAASMYDEFKEPLYAAPPLLLRLVEAGRLGRKTGGGFHPY